MSPLDGKKKISTGGIICGRVHWSRLRSAAADALFPGSRLPPRPSTSGRPRCYLTNNLSGGTPTPQSPDTQDKWKVTPAARSPDTVGGGRRLGREVGVVPACLPACLPKAQHSTVQCVSLGCKSKDIPGVAARLTASGGSRASEASLSQRSLI